MTLRAEFKRTGPKRPWTDARYESAQARDNPPVAPAKKKKKRAANE
jgi:hypothetical protein